MSGTPTEPAWSYLICDPQADAAAAAMLRLMRQHPGPATVHTVHTVTDLLTTIQARAPEVVLLRATAVGTISNIALVALCRCVPVLVYGHPQDARSAAAAIASGARGFLALPRIPRTPEHFQVVSDPPVAGGLTGREMDTLRGMSHGLTNTEIAAVLGCTQNMVKSYARRVYVRLHANDRAHAVAIAYRRQLLT